MDPAGLDLVRVPMRVPTGGFEGRLRAKPETGLGRRGRLQREGGVGWWAELGPNQSGAVWGHLLWPGTLWLFLVAV